MNPHQPTDLPRARIVKRTRFSLIWAVPVLAALAAAWLLGSDLWSHGPLISITFNNGDELHATETVLKYHGVRVGEVRSVRLTKDLQHVEVRVRLQRSAAGLARAGSLFWVVRPEVNSGGLHGLETIVSGPYLTVQPGGGPPQNQFTGLAEPPPDINPAGKLEVLLTTPQINTLSIGSPVYYRGIEVGSVAHFALSDDARLINIHLLIETNFAPLVRTNTKFWNAGGISFHLKLLGINVSAENFKSLIIGGIAFATPTQPGPPAPAGTVFPLNEKSDPDWLAWSPAIPIPNSQSHVTGNPSPATLLDDVSPSQVKSGKDSQ